MIIVNRKYTPQSFLKYLDRLIVKRQITKLVYHHTSSFLEKWDGSASILHYYNIYCSRGWASGPHIFIAPDGIWVFTDLRKRGTHAGKEGNSGSIGIEVVGRYYKESPKDEAILKYIAIVNYLLMNKFSLRQENLKRHLEYHPDSFCTPMLTQEWLMENQNNHSEYIKEVLSKR